MEKITTAEMARRDRNAAHWHVPAELLMENAGRAVAAEIHKDLSDIRGKHACVFSGLGNNGGDGFVVARHLAAMGAKPCVVLCGDPGRIRSAVSRANWKRLTRLRDSVTTVVARTSQAVAKTREQAEQADLLVDALLGTGIRGTLREPVASAIDLFNGAAGKRRTFAVDVPSGMDPDAGTVSDEATRVQKAVTFHRAKSGMPESCDYYEELVVAPIGIPPEAIHYVGPGDFHQFVKPRPSTSHKGQLGKVLVVGGSKTYCGAPALAALGAQRVGADLVIAGVPDALVDPVRAYSPNLIVEGLAESGDVITPPDVEQVLAPRVEWADAVLVGPGASTEAPALAGMEALIQLALGAGTPLVVDADGIAALQGLELTAPGSPVIVTPHRGEFQRLFGDDLYETDHHAAQPVVENRARETGLTVLLKGPVDVISDGSETRFNATGTPAMTVGGTGDVLAGVVTALIARGIPPFHAAGIGAFLCGRAGEQAEKTRGANILATEVIEFLPDAWQETAKS